MNNRPSHFMNFYKILFTLFGIFTFINKAKYYTSKVKDEIWVWEFGLLDNGIDPIIGLCASEKRKEFHDSIFND